MQVFLAIGIEGTDIVHVVTHDADHVCRKVGIYVTIIESVILVEVLFRHSQDTPHGLCGESHALQFSEYQQDRRTRTVPAQGDGLLEEQHLGDVVGTSDVLEVRRLVLGEPHGKSAVRHTDVAHLFQVGLHLCRYGLVLGRHRLAAVVRQLDEQQGVDAIFLVSLSQLLALFESFLQEALVHSQLRLLFATLHIRIEFDTLLDHLLVDDILSFHHHGIVTLGDWRSRHSQLDVWLDGLQHQLALLGVAPGKHVFLVDDNHHRQMLLYLGLAYQLIERAVLLVVTYHHGIVLVDALPVEEEHIAGMQTIQVVALVEHDWAEGTTLAEEVAHGAIALLMQLVRSYPYPSHSRISALAIQWEVTGQLIEQGAHHHRFTSSRRSLEYQSLAVFRVVEHLYHSLLQITHRFLLIIT